MREWMNRIVNSFFSDDIPLRGRLINICLLLTTLGGILAAISTMAQTPSVISILSILLVPACTICLQLWVRKTGHYRAGGFIFSIVLCDILLPIVFFFSGGIYSRMPVYFILGSVILFLLLGDNVKDCVLMTIVYLAINSACILHSYLNPQSVTPIQSEAMRYLDVIMALVISVFVVQLALWFQTQMYKKEQKRAEEAMRGKDEFLASMSHELRTPLNAIIGISEIQLKMKDDLPESSQEDVRKIHESGITLLRLINDLLDISKIGSGRFELVCGNYRTADMIHDTINMNKVRIGEKPIEFKVHVDPNLPTELYGDELRVRQVLSNVLSNAFKYTQKGEVTLNIVCRRKNGQALLGVEVSDTGIGIREGDIPKLFDKYTKLDSRKNHNIEGTGLGLSITQELLQLMAGDIEVSSVYGQGSTFSFELPQQIVDEMPIGKSNAEALSAFTYKPKESLLQETEHLSFRGMRALVVDDVEINLYITSEMLTPYDIEVDCVESGAKAIELISAAEREYDIVFMDHMMPGLDGIEATHIIRAEIDSDYARNVPIVALTANALVGNEALFLNNGFQAFLSKPTDLRQLDAVLRQFLFGVKV